MTDTTGNPYTSRTDDSLADLVTKMATSIRSFNAGDREQLLHAVAERLATGTPTEPVQLAGAFMFRPRPAVGDLLHPEAQGTPLNGVVVHGVTLADATQIADSLTASGLLEGSG